MTIYIYSPITGPTGGTELLQQFCSIARSKGHDAVMLYEGDPVGSPILDKFGRYDNPYVTDFVDVEDNSVLIPEHYAEFCYKVKHAKCAIWWMSVDNYWGAPYQPDGYSYKDLYRVIRRLIYRPVHFRNRKQFKQYLHFYQSEYARLYVSEEFGIKPDRLFALSDYISTDYCENELSVKRDYVLYNPKKGIKYTKQLIKADPSIQWTPLIGYSLEELVSLMQESKLYIDFGGHPGKDRLPREAAACGCCIITGRRGAAANSIDVPIAEEMKIDKFDVGDVLHRIRTVLSDYEAEYSCFGSYRELISEEKNIFEQETVKAISLLTSAR